MINYLYFEAASGRVVCGGFHPAISGYGRITDMGGGLSMFKLDEELPYYPLDSFVDPGTSELTPYPEMTSVSLNGGAVFVGDEYVLHVSGLPPGSKLAVSDLIVGNESPVWGPDDDVEGTEVEIAVDMPGTYFLRISCFPFVPLEMVFHAENP